LSDYRNRPAVDAPRIYAVTRRHALGFLLAVMIGVSSWYMVAVSAGLAFR
jgi:hypothetical protein